MVVGLLAVPRLLRLRQRRDRLARATGGDTDAAWQEIGAAGVDAGLPWPAHGTLRQQAAVVAAGLGPADPLAAGALPRVLQSVEVNRYAPANARPGLPSSVIVMDEPDDPAASGTDGGVAADAELVVAALAALPRPLADRVLPRSLRRVHD